MNTVSSLQDVARETGIPMRTVARVLRGENKERWTGTAERGRLIRETAERLGYRVNLSARATRTGRTDTLALLTASPGGRVVLPSVVSDALFQTLAERNLNLSVHRITPQQADDDRFLPKLINERIADGVLIGSADMPLRILDAIRRHQMPAVWIGVDAPQNAVFSDEQESGRQATEILLQAGHRRIAFADYYHGRADVPRQAGARQRGYLQAMQQAGLTPMILSDLDPIWHAIHQPVNFHGGRRLKYSLDWMSQSDCPTAVLTYGDETALPIVLAAERLGRRWPNDLSVITFGELLWQTSLSVDTMVTPSARIGREAVEMLLERIEHKNKPLPSRALRCDYRRGHTVGVPRRLT